MIYNIFVVSSMILGFDFMNGRKHRQLVVTDEAVEFEE
jgi:hypothetical protein